MEDKREIVLKYKGLGLNITKATHLAGMSRSSYYSSIRKGKKGRKASKTSINVSGRIIPDEEIVMLIKELLELDFVDYGYIKVTHWLHQRGIIINKKKVYRLMSENGLLNKSFKKSVSRTYVKYTRVLPVKPFEVLEMDIKCIYVHGTGQNALLLSIIDTFNRRNLGWICKYSIRKEDVKTLIDYLVLEHLQYENLISEKVDVIIRSDNGSQFISRMVREYMSDNFIIQEFTRPATPQQNGHIESFHAVVGRLVAEKYEFEDLSHLRSVLEAFFDFYNNRRIHSSICYLPPEVFQWAWNNMMVTLDLTVKDQRRRFKLIDIPVNVVNQYYLSKFDSSSEAETGNAGEQPVRNNLLEWNSQFVNILQKLLN